MTSQYSADMLKRSAVVRRRTSADSTAARPDAAVHPLLRLQQQIGNSQVARMLAQRDHMPEEEEPVQARHEVAQRQAEEEEEPVQARHELGMAMRQPDQEEEEVQAKPEVGLEGGPLSQELASRIQAKRGSGAPLDTSTRTAMESAFGTSFEDVRVHADAESDELNRRISARAFTTGSDIFFRQGVYDPSSSAGRELLSHELTHVVQQRSMNVGGPMTVNPAGDRYEQEADAVAAQVSRLAGSGEAQREMDEAGVQRQPMAEEKRRG